MFIRIRIRSTTPELDLMLTDFVCWELSLTILAQSGCHTHSDKTRTGRGQYDKLLAVVNYLG
jgi:hypothetical protein